MQGGESGAPRVGLTSTRVWPGGGKHRLVGGGKRTKANRLLSTEDSFKTYLAYMMDHLGLHVNWKKLKWTIQSKSIPF